MERAGKDDDVRALRERLGDLHRVLVRLRAAVREVGALLSAAYGRDLAELLREAHVAFVRHDVEHAVEIFLRLVFDRRDDFRVAVADVEHADAADPVEEAVAVEVFDDGALGALHHDGIAAVDRARHDRLAAGDDRSGLRTGELRVDFGQCISEHGRFLLYLARSPSGRFLQHSLRLSAAQEKEKKKRYGAGTPLAAPLPYRFSHLFF